MSGRDELRAHDGLFCNWSQLGVIVYHIWINTGDRQSRPLSPTSISSSPSGTLGPMIDVDDLNHGDFDLVRAGALESRRQLRFIVRVLVESGALYLLITIPHFAVWWTSSGITIVTLGWAVRIYVKPVLCVQH